MNKKKVIIITACVLLAVYAFFYFQQGLVYGNSFLKQVSSEKTATYLSGSFASGNTTATVVVKEYSVVMDIFRADGTINATMSDIGQAGNAFNVTKNGVLIYQGYGDDIPREAKSAVRTVKGFGYYARTDDFTRGVWYFAILGLILVVAVVSELLNPRFFQNVEDAPGMTNDQQIFLMQETTRLAPTNASPMFSFGLLRAVNRKPGKNGESKAVSPRKVLIGQVVIAVLAVFLLLKGIRVL